MSPGLDVTKFVTPIAVTLVSFPLLLQTLSNAGHDSIDLGFFPPTYGDIISPGLGTITRISIWVILIWTLLLVGLTFSVEKDMYKILSLSHAGIIGFLFLLALFRVPRLWIGSLPLFLLVAGVALILWKGYQCKD